MRNFIHLKKRDFCYRNFIRMSLCILIAGLVLMNASQVWAAEPYYKGKVLVLLANFGPGGSSDVWARLMSRHISRFIPGQPTVIVQNMPGGNGLLAYQWLTTVGKPDGLYLGCFGGGQARAEALGEFPPGTVSVRNVKIVTTIADSDVTFGRKEIFPQGYKSLLSPTSRPFVVCSLKRDDSYAVNVAMMELLGLKGGPRGDYKMVYGYPSANDAILAMARKEIDVYTQRVIGYRQTPLREVKAGNWVPLCQGGFITGTNQLIRAAGAEDIPTIDEVARELTGKDPSGPYYEFVRWSTGTKCVARFAPVHPNTPKEIVSILSEACRQMSKDPQYLSDQEKILGTKEQNMLFGEEAIAPHRAILDKGPSMMKVYEELISK